MALPTTEVATETVKAVWFGFMTDEEVRRRSFRKIINPNLLNTVGVPEAGGLYDPALGPLDEHMTCKSCGQRGFYCPGHCGHIDLVSAVYHPLLFNMLYSLLQNTCLFCFHFRVEPEEVEACVAKLNLIRKGDIIGARRLETAASISTINMHEECDSSLHLGGLYEQPKDVDQRHWTSFQLTEAFSVLNGFLKKRTAKCRRCKAKNPATTKPTFGWIHMNGLSAEQIKANIIRGCKLDGIADGDDDKSASEVEDAESPFSQGNVTSGQASNKWSKKKDELKSEFLKQQKSRSLLPSEVRAILERLWENEAQLCSFICDIQGHQPSQKNAGYLMFLLKTIVVPPTKFRPPSKGGESVMEHPQTVLLGKVLSSNISLGNAYEQRSDHSTIISRWLNLQQSINILFDSKSAAGIGQKEMASGICQLLEKKEGMFRQKMMGKRVNYACRSVISPDPCLAVNEIGIPPVFALRLTYPERVTPWNVTSLRDAIINGPDIHPGATHYVDRVSTVRLQPNRKSRISASRKLPSSRGVVTQPGRGFNYEYEGKVVHRHLRNGDIVLVNRQPTLHKPSIIALKVRVLPGEKTIRFHYANCDSFNADFDGDEINVHFPQDEISRAEAYNIVNADNQYIVPTRGDPKRALIQDHIVSAVLLTKRDTFLTCDQFNELLYASGVSSSGSASYNTKSGKKVSLLDSEDIIQVPPPAIVRPQRLWTGKQVISAILDHITKGCLPFTVKKRAKVAREYFGKDESKKKAEGANTIYEVPERKMSSPAPKDIDRDMGQEAQKDSKKKVKKIAERRTKVDSNHSMDEDIVFVYKNELVQGVIDKEQFGKYGLVHTVQEMYGPSTAGSVLSVFSRVFTSFLQMHGFTCGVDDLLLLQPYDNRRKQQLEICLNSGEEVHQQFVGHEKEHLDSSEMQVEIEKSIRRNGDAAIALLDGMMRSKLNSLTSAVTKIFPEGLVKPFRENCLSLMTLSGAKGGTFNFQQISLLLGQQELEGKRVPRMVSGKTLPCFRAWDSSARAGGFISDRYLTGLRPQEFYFHCMAGREGLVDTAVKTSRSGYLQRCLIKNLESLKVGYDYSVRDADGSIIQFRYGEDGVDVHQKNYLQEFEALAVNQQLILSKNPLSQMDNVGQSEYIEEDNDFPNELAKKAAKFINDGVAAGNYGLRRRKDRENFVKLVKSKYFMSLAQPGEPVGLIAGQSIGEPSTQMTLNTFHHAGRGEMNVTLGIPRLQEILMTASASIKTPTMTCPLLKGKSMDDAERLAAKLKRITIADLIEKIEVSMVPYTTTKRYPICTVYKLKIELYKAELYPSHSGITIKDCKRTLKSSFLDKMEDAIENYMLLLSKISGIKSEYQPQAKGGSDETDEDGSKKKSRTNDDDDDDDDGDDDNGEGDEDLGSDAQKRKLQAMDEMDYEEDGEGEDEEGNPTAEPESEVDPCDNEGKDETQQEDEDTDENPKQDVPGRPSRPELTDDEEKVEGEEGKKRKSKSREDRRFYYAFDGLYFEVHYQFDVKEPHILLAQIAQTTAKKVYVKSAGAIEQCKAVEVHLDESAGGIPMLRKGKETRPGLQTAGVDFVAFWKMQDELDIRRITSNDIHAMLNTYGVEAARAAIITEIFTVFNHYGVSVDMRHLTLIADYMTHNGGYRPMSRSGGIAESISPFSKMSFETASKFLVEAASHGRVDNLETPSARITLGLPAKVGTGCFDLMHQIDV